MHTPPDRLDDSFEELERIHEAEQPLTLTQKWAVAGLVVVAVGGFGVVVSLIFR